MHEVGIMQSTLEIAFGHAARQGANRIHRLGMRVGAFSGVVPDALAFAFEVLKRDTPASDAALEVESIPLRIFCGPCGREFEWDGFSTMCTGCGSFDTEIRQGRELELAFVELSAEGASDGATARAVDG